MKKLNKKWATMALSCALLLPAVSMGAIKAPTSMEEARMEYTDAAVTTTAVLKQGSKGGEVKEVQRRLKMWGYYNGSVDGVFGAGTRSAVISFQKKNSSLSRKRNVKLTLVTNLNFYGLQSNQDPVYCPFQKCTS